MAILTPSQLTSASNATYFDNTSGSITPTSVRSLNDNWISSSILVSQTGSMSVATASFVVSASYAATASFALNSELLDGLDSTSFVSTSSFNSLSSSLVNDYATKAQVTSSVSVLSGSVQVSQNALSSSLSSRVTSLESFSSSLDSIYATDASVTASINVLSGSVQASQLALSSSVSTRFGLAPTLAGNNTFSGNNIFGNVTASNAQITSASVLYLTVQYETASVIYSSGSNQFGDTSNDVQTLYGTVDVKTGPLLVTGSMFVSGNINMVNGADIVTHHVKAVGSNGIEIQNQSAGVVGLFGAGGSLGTTFYGQVGAVSFVGSGSGVIGVVSSSYAATASVLLGSVVSASYAVSSSYAETASVLLGTVATASFALTASSVNTLNQDVTISGSLNVTGSQVINSGSLIMYSHKIATENSRSLESILTSSLNSTNNIVSILSTSANSTGSFILSGSGNYVSISSLPGNSNINNGYTFGFNGTNSYVTVLPFITGSNPNVNVPGLKNNRYVPTFTNSNVNNSIVVNDNRGSETTNPITILNSSTNNNVTFTLTSGSIAMNNTNLLGSNLTVSNNRTGSSSNSDTIQNSFIGGTSPVIQIFSSGSSTASVTNILMLGNANRALVTGSSVAVAGSNTANPNLRDVSLLGNNLIVTGSSSNTTISEGLTIVGSYNEGASGLLNDARFTRFAVGTGNAAATRRTSFHVSASGLTSVLNGLNVSQSLLITGSSFQVSGSLIDVTGSMTITGSLNGLVVSQSIASSTSSFNFGAANFFTSLVTGSTFFDITSPKAGETVNVLLTTQGAGQATASFSTNVKQVSGSSYVPTAGNSKNDILTFISFDGTSVYLANIKNLV